MVPPFPHKYCLPFTAIELYPSKARHSWNHAVTLAIGALPRALSGGGITVVSFGSRHERTPPGVTGDLEQLALQQRGFIPYSCCVPWAEAITVPAQLPIAGCSRARFRDESVWYTTPRLRR